MKNAEVTVSESIQNKHVEVHYNQKNIRVNGKDIHIELQGKINCPVLNSKVSSLVCSKIMDQKGWPRACDPTICDSANCKIYKSIRKNVASRNEKRSAPNKTK